MPLRALGTRHPASRDARRALPASIGRHGPIALVRGAVVLLALASAGAAQQTLHVDALGGAGAYTTIQSAIDAAATGDTILVAPGLYLETIDYLGKDLEVIADGAGGPATHVIDAQGDPFIPIWAPGEQFGGGPVVTFANGEGPGALLEGFTVTGGRGWSPGNSGEDAGGIRILGSSPTIRNCHVVGNAGGAGGHSSYGGNGGAGGLFVSGGAPRILSCEIRDNVGGSYIMGSLQSSCGVYSGGPGGMLVYPDNPWLNSSDVQIVDCLFDGNVGAPGLNLSCQFPGGGQPSHGPGALWVVDGSVDISGCVFSGNEGVQDAQPQFHASSPGGVLVGRMDGLTSWGWFTGDTRITESQFLGNTKGAVFLSGPDSTLTLEGCVLWGNTGRTVSSRTGSAFPLEALSLVDCVLIGNSGGPAVWSDTSNQVRLEACVIWGHDTAGAPIFCAELDGPSGCVIGSWTWPANVDHSILYGNVGTLGNPSTAASCVEGGAPGSGNISADPLFVRAPSPGPDGSWGTEDDDLGDLHLAPGSPCIDAGDNSIVPFGLHADAAGHVRFFDDPATPDTGVAGMLGGPAVVDIGPYEYGSVLPAAEWTDLGQGLTSTVWPHGPALVGSGALVGDAPTTLLLVDASPNAQAFLVLGLSQVDVPFKQGLLVPSPDVILPLPVDGAGAIAFTVPWPLGLPSGLEFLFQVWIPDAAGPEGFFASNGLKCVTP